MCDWLISPLRALRPPGQARLKLIVVQALPAVEAAIEKNS